MKAIVNTGPGRLEMKDLSLPQPTAGWVRIRTGACAICATDLEMITGWQRTSFPVIPGHEWAGFVDAVGPDADPSIVGRKCVAENVLADGGEVGFEHPGGYAEYFLTERRKIQLLPDDFSLTTAALIEPLAVCVRGIRRLGPDVSDPVLIFGDGPIGLIMLWLLRRGGARNLVLVGGREKRLMLAKDFGATAVLNYHDVSGDLCSALRAESPGRFATIVEASGSHEAIHAAVELAAVDCRILVLGDYGEACARFPWNHILHREIRMIGSNASTGAWQEAVWLAVEEKLPLHELVSHELSASQFDRGFELMRSRDPHVLKVVLRWIS